MIQKLWGNDFKKNRLWVISSLSACLITIGTGIGKTIYDGANALSSLSAIDQADLKQHFPSFMLTMAIASLLISVALAVFARNLHNQKWSFFKWVRNLVFSTIILTVMLPVALISGLYTNTLPHFNAVLDATTMSLIISSLCFVIRKHVVPNWNEVKNVIVKR